MRENRVTGMKKQHKPKRYFIHVTNEI